MKVLLIVLVALSLLCTGCATTELSYEPGGSVAWKSKTLWKDVKDAEVVWGDMTATLGSSMGNGKEEMIACMLAPQLCQ
jgi:hypothetical protein